MGMRAFGFGESFFIPLLFPCLYVGQKTWVGGSCRLTLGWSIRKRGEPAFSFVCLSYVYDDTTALGGVLFLG